ncbi:Uncharacterised protein [uncultured archaeon]|nr:Uncharacterised protein [uncultured archaeon]
MMDITFDDVLRMALQKPGEKTFPVSVQVACLGLDTFPIRGLHTLDVGCGDGRLLEYLLSEGAIAEGIGPLNGVRHEHIIPNLIYNVAPHSGSIPRPNETYDLSLAHNVVPVRRAFCSLYNEIKSSDPETPSLVQKGGIILLEVHRVLRKGGRFVVFPQLDELDPANARFSYGFDLKHEKVPEAYFLAEGEPQKYRTVLTKL